MTFKSNQRKYLPYAFTEQVVAMLSSVLRSERAINVNTEIMRTFTKMRHAIDNKKDDSYIEDLRKMLFQITTDNKLI